MKQLSLLAILLATSLSPFAQSFAPVGAEWHFGKASSLYPIYEAVRLYVEKDTVVLGDTCSKIVKDGDIICSFRPEVEFIKSNADSVWLYNPDFNQFELLFDFSAQAGDSWSILETTVNFPNDTDTVVVHVDSIATTTINNTALRVLYLTYTNAGSPNPPRVVEAEVIERLGDMSFLFNFGTTRQQVICDFDYSTGLRCYEDGVLGFHATGIAPSCTDNNVSVAENAAADPFEIFPNPADRRLQFRSPYPTPVNLEFKDLNGRLLYRETFTGQTSIITESLPSGIYWVQLHTEGHANSIRKVVVR
ncbi:MAG: T9SS type A sorting domain-containing protein [Salibacteraceae bacterium]